MSLTIFLLSYLFGCAIAGPLTEKPTVWSSVSVKQSVNIARVVGGVEAQIEDFPHQVSLQYRHFNSDKLKHFCGGSIINELWVVTAGSCANIPILGNLTFFVKAGNDKIFEFEPSQQLIEVDKTFVHEDYIGYKMAFDIALLKLKTSLKFNKRVQPIALPTRHVEPTGLAILTGWGLISITNSTSLSNTLQSAVLPLINRKTCNTSIIEMSHGKDSPLGDTNICTGPLAGGFGTCIGDAGNPLIFKKINECSKLIGIASYGLTPCGVKGYPSVFIKVAEFVDWIIKILKNN